MQARIPVNHKKGPEAKIQEAIIAMLRYRGWFVMNTHGNMFQAGFPDLYATHTDFKARWVEVKNPFSYKFTPAQLDKFPKFESHGAGVWILTAATEAEYKKLFSPSNWYQYLSIMK